VWDAGGVLKNTLKVNPQVKYLKEKPDEAIVLTVDNYKSFVSEMKFKDVQKFAGSLMVYDMTLNQTVVRFLEKSGIRSAFDIGIQLVRDPEGPNLGLLKRYVALMKTYQTKAKKDTLNIYVMADNYTTVSQFQTYCDPSWKITSLSKTPAKDSDSMFIQTMGEVQIMTAVPALILDFQRPIDRFIYLMQRNTKLTYFVELNDAEWNLL